ncbi:tyrosine-type recombinase/integrase [Paeniglutamicibacter terrestris]|uniref:Site-specific integrase n=1 Tax=Paeniglutamicibacter terrestris TaxID=2723403 RepID=A0ABX1G963_9MICC|nr:site-specific integrase [Paeniglutamicibacter terrestris]NKG22185.1 site-specific integrase [Paeniglutamicibacter terrestris]
MASIRTRAKKDGTSTYTVNWRDPDLGLKSQSFSDHDKAINLKNFLDANGNSHKIAKEAKLRKDSTAPTVSETVKRHIDLLRKPQPGTIDKYRRMASSHIYGTDFGATPSDQVTTERVTKWFDGLTVSQGANQTPGKPLARKTKQTVHAIVSAAFKRATEEGKMAGNPAKGIGDADLHDAREPVYLSPEDLDKIADAMPKEYQLFVQFLGGTGLRYSEATALRRRDVVTSAGRCVVRVTRAWKSIGGGEEIGPPKTKKALRNVTCGVTLSAALTEHMKDLPPDELVFRRPGGQYMRNAIFHKEVWQPVIGTLVAGGALDRAPWIHEIRHAHTTHLLQKNVPVHTVQARLGHEDPQTTLKVYARLASGDDLAAADALD